MFVCCFLVCYINNFIVAKCDYKKEEKEEDETNKDEYSLLTAHLYFIHCNDNTLLCVEFKA